MEAIWECGASRRRDQLCISGSSCEGTLTGHPRRSGAPGHRGALLGVRMCFFHLFCPDAPTRQFIFDLVAVILPSTLPMSPTSIDGVTGASSTICSSKRSEMFSFERDLDHTSTSHHDMLQRASTHCSTATRGTPPRRTSQKKQAEARPLK